MGNKFPLGSRSKILLVNDNQLQPATSFVDVKPVIHGCDVFWFAILFVQESCDLSDRFKPIFTWNTGVVSADNFKKMFVIIKELKVIDLLIYTVIAKTISWQSWFLATSQLRVAFVKISWKFYPHPVFEISIDKN